MVQINFDQFLWLAEQEAKKLDTTAKPIYHSAYKQLSDAYEIAAKDAREADGLTEPDRSHYLEWLKEEYQQQRVALASATFALLWRTVKLHLQSMVNWVGNRFPLQSQAQGRNELDRTVSEYRSRFGISLESFHTLPWCAKSFSLAIAPCIRKGSQARTTCSKPRSVV